MFLYVFVILGEFGGICIHLHRIKSDFKMGLVFKLSKKSIISDGMEFYNLIARFHIGNIDQYAKTGIFIPSSFTDKNGNKKETWRDGHIVIPRISYADKKSVDLNKVLSYAKETIFSISNAVEQSYRELSVKGENPPKGWLQDIITVAISSNVNKNAENGQSKYADDVIGLVDALNGFINNERNPLKQGTLKQYRLIVKHVSAYEKKRKVSLKLDETTSDDLYKIWKFIIGKGESENYVVCLFRKFRTFYRWANGLSKTFPIKAITSNNPFSTFSCGSEQYGTPFYLTIDERNALQDADMGSDRLERQRDIFVFQCLIGCRISDLYALTKASVIRDAIEYIPRKTKDGRPITVRVPLNERAKAIIEKYADFHGDRLLPLVNMVQYNEDIKEMLRVAGITRCVTILDPVTREEVKRPICDVASSHMARRTFVGNLYKQVKDPNLIGKLSGHVEGSKAFSRYRDIDEDMAKELVSLLE